MENIYYGEFRQEERDVLDTLDGTWVFWKVKQGKRNGFYAWNTDWPKDNRIVAGDFVEFHNSLNKYLAQVMEYIEKYQEKIQEFRRPEKSDSSEPTHHQEPYYHPVAMEAKAVEEVHEQEEEIVYIEPSGPEISWTEVDEEDLEDLEDDDLDVSDEPFVPPPAKSDLVGKERLDAIMEELERAYKR